MDVHINLNEVVKFKLSDHGKDIFYHQYDSINEYMKTHGGRIIEPSMPKVDEDGYTEMQLWVFMELYGKHMGNGMKNCIENNDLIYTIGQ